jgi:hypothetical protein
MAQKGNKVYGPQPKEFKPLNPHKYKGKTPIILRSKLELEFARWVDRHSSCISWGCESAAVKYRDPSKQLKVRTYFIDFTATFRTANGEIKKYYIEIKPFRQTQVPKNSKRKKETTFLKEQKTYATNVAKWKAAGKFAKKKGGTFKIITERDIHVSKK